MNHDRIKKALPVESGPGARSKLRMRPDVVEIVLDCVLQRRTFVDIAKRCGVEITTLDRFRAKFLTPEVEKIVLAEAQAAEQDALDEEINVGQTKLEHGVMSIIDEQKRLYRKLNAMADADGNDSLLEVLSPMMQLLRDQTKSYDGLLKVYANLKDKTTTVLPLSEHPEIAKLMDALWVVFKLHPDAFEEFKQVAAQKKLPLDVA